MAWIWSTLPYKQRLMYKKLGPQMMVQFWKDLEIFEIGNQLEEVGCQDHVPVGDCTFIWALLSSCSPRDDYHVLHNLTAIKHISMGPAETEALTMGWKYWKGEIKLFFFLFGSYFSLVLRYLWPHLQERWSQWGRILCNKTGLYWNHMTSRTYIGKNDEEEPGHRIRKNRPTL